MQSPINQRFDDLRADLNSRFTAQDKRIDDLKDAMNQRFDVQDKFTRERFQAVGQRFDALDLRLERLENDMSELRKLSERVSRNGIRIDTIERQLTSADAPSP